MKNLVLSILFLHLSEIISYVENIIFTLYDTPYCWWLKGQNCTNSDQLFISGFRVLYNLAIYAADIGLPGHGTLMTWKQCVDLCLAADVCAAVCSLAPMFNGNTYCKAVLRIRIRIRSDPDPLSTKRPL